MRQTLMVFDRLTQEPARNLVRVGNAGDNLWKVPDVPLARRQKEYAHHAPQMMEVARKDAV